jgi:large subunit ribosomal protein L15
LFANGLISKKRLPVKVLGEGELNAKLTVKVEAVSKSAKEKIEKVGGSVVLS